MNHPLAIFDLDGTLFRWHWWFRLMEELIASDTLPPSAKSAITQALEQQAQWEQRKLPFRTFETEYATVIKRLLPDLPCAVYEAAVERIVPRYEAHTYVFTRELMRHLATTHTIAALTGSPEEVVTALQHTWPLHLFRATIFERKDGAFTGTLLQEPYYQKAQLIQELLQEGGHPTGEGVIGVGDTQSDIAMLNTLDFPIAFNPNAELVAHALEHGWMIATERKNVLHVEQAGMSSYFNTDEPLPLEHILEQLYRTPNKRR